MSKYHSGIFIPKNPQKYLGHKKISWRSSWEKTFMQFLDEHPSVLNWVSESVQIPYSCPVTGRVHKYIPDFIVVYKNKEGKQVIEMIEIKPLSETGRKKTKSTRTNMIIARNQAKWASAQKFCEDRGMSFRVLTEQDIFHTGKRI